MSVPLRYLSVCSGIEAATVAWHSLGWEPLAFAEIDAFPRAVLTHHYPDVPLFDDFTALIDEPWLDQVDLLVGGTPCQAFSVAGLRQSLADHRGNLALEFIRLVNAIDDARYAAGKPPVWVLWENVPGVLSTRDNAFGSFLGGLVGASASIVPDRRWTRAGVVAGPDRMAAWRELDAQHFGLAQRRKRIFVCARGGVGGWACADALLPLIESLSGHPPPSREARQVAPTVPSRRSGGGGLGTDFDCDGGLIAGAVSAKWAKGTGGPAGDECYNLTLAHALRADGFDASADQAGPLDTDGHSIAIAFDTTQITHPANRSNPKPGDPCHPLAAGAHPPAIAFSAKDHGADAGDIAPTLRAGGHTSSHANGGVMPAVAIHEPFTLAIRGRGDSHDLEYRQDGTANALLTPNGGRGGIGVGAVAAAMAVRRLTPRECERLQGFPDDYTLIPYRGKPAADGPRYKALGNSMAVPVMRWIGAQIARVCAVTEAT